MGYGKDSDKKIDCRISEQKENGGRWSDKKKEAENKINYTKVICII